MMNIYLRLRATLFRRRPAGPIDVRAAEASRPTDDLVRAHLTIRGAVQGVGFRPCVYRLAMELEMGQQFSARCFSRTRRKPLAGRAVCPADRKGNAGA